MGFRDFVDAHPPFQIDGNFGGTSAIAEMLLQSQTSEIELLPALPGAWVAGHVTGLRARGGIEIDIAWSGGKLTGVKIRSVGGREATVRYGDRTTEVKTKSGDTVQWNSELQRVGNRSGGVISDEWLAGFISKSSADESPCFFSVIPVEILGVVYERFLGKVVHAHPTPSSDDWHIANETIFAYSRGLSMHTSTTNSPDEDVFEPNFLASLRSRFVTALLPRPFPTLATTYRTPG